MRQLVPLAAATLLMCLVSRATAQQSPLSLSQYAAAVNLPAPNMKLSGNLTFRSDAKRIRCVVLVVHQGIMSEQLFSDRSLQNTAHDAKCATVLAAPTYIELRSPQPPPSENPLWNASLGGAAAISMFLERIADDSGHDELRHSPILIWGFSAAASFATTYAALHPDRTIGFVRYHVRVRDVPMDLQRLKDIPALLIAGAEDESAGVQDAEAFWQRARQLSAPWTFAVEPNAQHSSPDIQQATAKALTIPWIRAVIEHRLAADGTLRPITPANSWFANPNTREIAVAEKFDGDRTSAAWLPNEEVAKGWNIVMNGGLPQ
jgi:predicted esterase